MISIKPENLKLKRSLHADPVPSEFGIILLSEQVCFCPYCGTKMNDDASFCTRCGRPLSTGNDNTLKTAEDESRNNDPFRGFFIYKDADAVKILFNGVSFNLSEKAVILHFICLNPRGRKRKYASFCYYGNDRILYTLNIQLNDASKAVDHYDLTLPAAGAGIEYGRKNLLRFWFIVKDEETVLDLHKMRDSDFVTVLADTVAETFSVCRSAPVTVYDSSDAIVYFLGLGFDRPEQKLRLYFDWSFFPRKKHSIYFKYVTVNGIRYDSMEILSTVYTVLSGKDFSYSAIRTIEFQIEVRDKRGRTIGTSGNLAVAVDTAAETFQLKINHFDRNR